MPNNEFGGVRRFVTLKLAVMICAFGTAAQAHLDEQTVAGDSAVAASVPTTIDLSHWKLQLPVRPIEVTSARLLAGYQDKYFHAGPVNGALDFWCPASDFVTTANTRFPRTELREMLDPTNSATNWSWQGTHVMSVREAVMQVSPSGKTVVMQIHAATPDGKNAPPLVKGRFYRNTLDFLVKNAASGGKDAHFAFSGIALGQAFDAELKVVDGVLDMTVDGQTKSVDFVSRDAGWKDLKFYFKVGNYLQDTQPAGSDAGALVRLYRLDVRHAD